MIRRGKIRLHSRALLPASAENPWLEETEREDSANPYHDWNERINMECYRANTAARLVDEGNRVLNLRNNYRQFSFNFGPTLIQWIERHDPWVYQAIIDSDKESLKERGGHGNAIAQVYNHVIMPLANQRDKVTQVRWGIRDFESRFGRHPEGMWLAETAVDRSTLAVLAEAGIKFTILSPYQAARWRFIGEDAQWREAPGGSIPPGAHTATIAAEVNTSTFSSTMPRLPMVWPSTACWSTAASSWRKSRRATAGATRRATSHGS